MRTSVACGGKRFSEVGSGPAVSTLSRKGNKPLCSYLQAQREATRAHAPHMRAQEIVGEQFHVVTQQSGSPEPEGSTLLLCTTSAVEAPGRFAGPEVDELRELCGSRETGRTVLGRVLMPEAFLGETAKAYDEPRSL